MPTASLTAPAASDVPVSTSSITLSFSETVTSAADKVVTISNGSNTYAYTIGESDSLISVTDSDCTATIPISSFLKGTPQLSLRYNTDYTVAVEAGAYIDQVGNIIAASNIGSFTTEALRRKLYDGSCTILRPWRQFQHFNAVV